MNENQTTKTRDENFCTVHGWMTKLGLSIEEMIVYAVIRDHSQSGTCSVSYLAEWLNASEHEIKSALSSLEEKGYVIRKDTPSEPIYALPTEKKGA